MMGGLPTQVFGSAHQVADLVRLPWGFDEIAGKGLARRDDVYPLIADLIRAERTQRLDRLSLQQLVIAMPYTTQFNNAYYFGIKLPRLAFIKGRGYKATEV
jgi:hypothetical protein